MNSLRKHCLKERFLNFETSKGIYLVPAGAILAYMSVKHVEFTISTAGLLFGVYGVYEGLRKIFVNRFAQARKQRELAETYANLKQQSNFKWTE